MSDNRNRIALGNKFVDFNGGWIGKQSVGIHSVILRLIVKMPQNVDRTKVWGLDNCKLRRVKYLNNVIEQDHRFIKKRVRAAQCFRSFTTADKTLSGIEAMNMIRKGQVKRLSGDDAKGQAQFVQSLFQIAV